MPVNYKKMYINFRTHGRRRSTVLSAFWETKHLLPNLVFLRFSEDSEEQNKNLHDPIYFDFWQHLRALSHPLLFLGEFKRIN